jgi:glucose-1-phosphatase
MADLVLGNRTYLNVKNIIFDLGGVIMNIDYKGAMAALKKTGLFDLDDINHQTKRIHLFEQYEIGSISSDAFRKGLQDICGLKVSDSDFDHAWNSMLVDIPGNRLELLKTLRKKFRLFLLSNTNEIHLDYLSDYMLKNYGFNGIDPLFEKAYYSCRMQMRKPEHEIYNSVLHDSNLNAIETLFIDDFQPNIEAAIQVGIQAYHLSDNEDITSSFA